MVLAAFALVTAGAVVGALRPEPPCFADVIAKTLHGSGQFAVRPVVLLLVAMPGLAEVLDLDILLGAFAAGMFTRLILTGAAPASGELVPSKVEAMGFGFLVPLSFVVTALGVEGGMLDPGEAAAPVGAGLVSVLAFPLLALKCRAVAGRRARPSERVSGQETW
ncbi:cation:proton antiporter domain-containing protein [Streptomyces sp. NBC_00239]|uniref:cation:proton antiporter domain-containing protein n=1 Tax=Streptomyces sp. NBC_00239 TaxID=2903640 RepID=UPI002E2C271F|nr:cation:proton antiporter [Streptomyces sp. NBC_00239]